MRSFLKDSLMSPRLSSIFLILCLLGLSVTPAQAASSLDGSQLSLLWAAPFAGILLSLALFPLFAADFWHAHFGKVSFLWGLSTILMIFFSYGFNAVISEIIVTYLDHFIPFIVFILSLYVISTGIKIDIAARATPLFNTVFITIAGFLASWIGTTGAAMLFITPYLAINSYRHYKTHLIVFFIFIVCNIGGCLSAIGDPPLFLGFLNGVDFFWPTTHLFPAFITVFIPLLIIFYAFDLYHYRKEDCAKHGNTYDFHLKITGRKNVVLLIFAVSAIIASGQFATEGGFDLGATTLYYSSFARDIGLLILTGLSVLLTRKDIRQANNFSWFPFLEVFKVFAAIFITASPVLAILKAGPDGVLSWLIELVNTPTGPDNELYFWVTGVLSSMLDNAPTYLVFFNLAGGDAEVLMVAMERTLIAISLGSVFMGAMTYIGNAPNFMVKAIAEQNNIRMPSFFGYVVWSIFILLPLFFISEIIWIK